MNNNHVVPGRCRQFTPPFPYELFCCDFQMPNKLLIESEKYSEAFLPERKGDASRQMNLACKSHFHKITEQHFHHHFVVFRVLLASLRICCRCALIPAFSVAPLMMYICPVIGRVTRIDTIYSADGRTAQGVYWQSFRNHRRKTLWIFVVWVAFYLFVVFFSSELWLMAVSDIATGRMWLWTPCIDFRKKW